MVLLVRPAIADVASLVMVGINLALGVLFLENGEVVWGDRDGGWWPAEHGGERSSGNGMDLKHL
jgi:hypothetical protein